MQSVSFYYNQREQQQFFELFSVNPIKSPIINFDKARSSRLCFNDFFIATEKNQKDNGLEIDFMLDTGVFCSFINFRTFWEKCQLRHYYTESTKVTKTYSEQAVPTMDCATIIFSYDPEGQIIFLFGSRRWNLRRCLEWQNPLSSIYSDLLGLRKRTLPFQFVEAGFVKTNFTLINLTNRITESFIWFPLMLNVLYVGKTVLKIFRNNSQKWLLLTNSKRCSHRFAIIKHFLHLLLV